MEEQRRRDLAQAEMEKERQRVAEEQRREGVRACVLVVNFGVLPGRY